MHRLVRRALEDAPPVVAAALLAEVFVPRLHSPLRELPYFFALWAACAAAWRVVLYLARVVKREHGEEILP